MSRVAGSPRPAGVTPTRTKTSASAPTKSSSTTPTRTSTDKPEPRGTGGPVGAKAGASAPTTGTPSKPSPSKPGTSKPRPTKPSPTKPGASKPGASQPAKNRPLIPPALEARIRESGPIRQEALDLILHADKTRNGSSLNPFDGRTWDPDSDDLTKAKNAHHSNTPEEMREALDNDYNWLEGDLRVADNGELVMAHDADKEGDGLTLNEWLAIGASSERGMKIDVKEQEAIPELLDRLEESGIPDGRIMLNVGTGVGVEGVREMRERFPDAWLALNPSPGDDNDYGPDDLRQVTELADAAGGRVAFPLRWDLVTDDVIKTLKPHGKVSIWTSKGEGTPDDAGAEARRLRERGVDGVIDLGPPQSLLENVAEFGQDIWQSGPVRGARDGIGWLGDRGSDILDFGGSLFSGARDLGGDLLDGAADLGGDVLDGAGDLASGAADLGGDIISGAGDIAEDLPLVGGLFGG